MNRNLSHSLYTRFEEDESDDGEVIFNPSAFGSSAASLKNSVHTALLAACLVILPGCTPTNKIPDKQEIPEPLASVPSLPYIASVPGINDGIEEIDLKAQVDSLSTKDIGRKCQLKMEDEKLKCLTTLQIEQAEVPYVANTQEYFAALIRHSFAFPRSID